MTLHKDGSIQLNTIESKSKVVFVLLLFCVGVTKIERKSKLLFFKCRSDFPIQNLNVVTFLENCSRLELFTFCLKFFQVGGIYLVVERIQFNENDTLCRLWTPSLEHRTIVYKSIFSILNNKKHSFYGLYLSSTGKVVTFKVTWENLR